MKLLNRLSFTLVILLIMFNFSQKSEAKYEKKIYDFSIETLSGKKVKLSEYKESVFLLVNVASKCGFTKQYDDLQALWEKYKNDGLIVIGFPSNQFGEQEPGTNAEIKDFCETNFGINFLMSKKVNVKGKEASEIYKWANKNFGKSAVPKWNFHKILINKEGKIEETYSSFTGPLSEKLTTTIEKSLK